MLGYFFHSEASLELETTAAYYEAQRVGLGGGFLSEASRALSLIRQFPEASPAISARSRRRRVRRFPYGLIYQIRKDDIAILAVMNLRRKPGYWLDREK